MRSRPKRRRAAARVLALLAASAAPWAAALPEFEEPPALYVETVAVDGAARVSPELVLSEARLAPEASYTEADLRAAVWRVKRLPFVLDADFALARGSERGKLRLVIRVEEVRRFFFGGEALVSWFDDDLVLEKTSPSSSLSRFQPAVGARFFTDDFGVAFVAVGGDRVQAGYTRYRLFGRRATLSVGVERSGCCPVTVPPLGLDPGVGSWSSDEGSERATLAVGLPVGSGSQSLRLLASVHQADQGRRRPVFGAADAGALPLSAAVRDFRDRSVELAWISDTTDDPDLPTRGRNFTAALELRELDGVLTDAGPAPFSRATSSRLLRASFSATGHWPVYRRHTISATLRLAAGRSRLDPPPVAGDSPVADDLDVSEGSIAVRHAVEIWRSPAPAQELWWESVVEAGYEQISPVLAPAVRRYSVTSGVTWRSPWGIFRFGVSFIDFERVL